MISPVRAIFVITAKLLGQIKNVIGIILSIFGGWQHPAVGRWTRFAVTGTTLCLTVMLTFQCTISFCLPSAAAQYEVVLH